MVLWILLFVCGWNYAALACATLDDGSDWVRVARQSTIIVWDASMKALYSAHLA